MTRRGQRPVSFFFFFVRTRTHMKRLKVFKIGDRVKVISLNNDNYGRIGKITISIDRNDGQQLVRVAFNSGIFDYTDVLSQSIKKA